MNPSTPRSTIPETLSPYPTRFRSVVMNAVRYGGRARVSLGRENGEPVVTVDDDGPGIAPENLERVFEPFVRLEESRSRETGGLGQIGRAHVRTPVTNAHLGCRLLLAKKKNMITNHHNTPIR